MSPRLTLALAEVRAAFAALDFSAENTQIANLEAERDEIGAAENRAQRRIEEIRDRLARQGELNPRAIADRLLASSGEVADLAPNSDDLRQEITALQQGAHELRQRLGLKGQGIDAARAQARKRLGDAMAPLTSALIAEAKEAAETVRTCYASYAAAMMIAPAEQAGKFALDAAMTGIVGTAVHHGLLPRTSTTPVPREIRALFNEFDWGAALPIRAAHEVSAT